MKKISLLTAVLAMTMGLLPKACWATSSIENAALIQRDLSYEQALKYEASADKTITPAKVLRWVMGMRGQAVSAPSLTEFQPIVNVHDSRVRVIAAIAYKF